MSKGSKVLADAAVGNEPLLDWLSYEFVKALDAEHTAAVLSDQTQTNIRPKYEPSTYYAIQYARTKVTSDE